LKTQEKDIALIQEALKGKEKAFQALYLGYKNMLFIVCLRYAKNRTDAEDYLQEAFIKIFNKLHQFDYNKGNFGSWARKIAINTCLEKLRKSSLYLVNIAEAESIESLDTNVLSNMSLQEMLSLVQRLPEGYKTIFNMYVIDGFTHQEIADKLKISVSTSKTQLMKARGLLQKKIKNIQGLVGIKQHG